MSYAFFALSAYIAFEAGSSLIHREAPQINIVGMVLATASLVMLPVLFLLKYRLGKRIGSKSLIADSKETLACSLLSVTLLAGLTAFALWHLWWVDAVSALVIALLVFREGMETLNEANE